MRLIATVLFSLSLFPITAAAGDAGPWLNGQVVTVAGIPGVGAFHDGPQHEATFNRPTWLDVVAGDSCGVGDGDIYVVDRLNQSMRKISGGVVSTYAVPFMFDFDGPLGGGILMEPRTGGCGCGDYDRGMFVTSSGTEQIVLVGLAGGLGNRDGSDILGQHRVAGAVDGPSTSALFRNPGGLARSWNYGRTDVSQRFLYVADTGNHTIRRVSFNLSFEGCPRSSGVSTMAGSAGVSGSDDGPAARARFLSPRGVAAAPDGTIYVSDTGNHTIRRITPDGIVSTVAGEAGVAGSDDGPALQAHLNTPSGIDVNASGDVFIADTGNDTIRMLTRDGALVTIAGTPGVCGSAGGLARQSRFCTPVGLRVHPDGSLYIADTSNDIIRRIVPATTRRRVAGR